MSNLLIFTTFRNFFSFQCIRSFGNFRIRNNIFYQLCYSILLVLGRKKDSRIFFSTLQGNPPKKNKKTFSNKKCELQKKKYFTRRQYITLYILNDRVGIVVRLLLSIPSIYNIQYTQQVDMINKYNKSSLPILGFMLGKLQMLVLWQKGVDNYKRVYIRNKVSWGRGGLGLDTFQHFVAVSLTVSYNC